jgi:hypothetical protein
MPMKLKRFFLAAALSAVSALQAAPQFWEQHGTITPTMVVPQPVEEMEPSSYKIATPTPEAAPQVQFATPTPTPLPGLSPKNPTQAAIFSAVVPGSGHFYSGDPVKGILFAAIFGVGLWQTIDNFQLIPETPGSTTLKSKNEDLGHLFGLVTLAAYGFGIQDAYSAASNYNKNNNLTLRFGISPKPNFDLAYRF